MSRTDAEVTPAEERMVTSFMLELRSASVGVPMHTPTAEVVWLKAQLVRRWEAQRQVWGPLDAMESFEMAACFAAALLLLTWTVPAAFQWLPRLVF